MAEENDDKLNIARSLKSIEVKVDLICQNLMKLIYCCLGIIAASIGVKFIGTPLTTTIFVYASFIAGILMAGNLVTAWKKLTRSQKLIRASFTCFLLFSVVCRIIVFQPGEEVAPLWFTPMIDAFFILISCILMAAVWNNWEKKAKE